MSVSLWNWSESCEGQPCCGDCDLCAEAEARFDRMLEEEREDEEDEDD